MGELKDKVAIVTGAGRGIGLGIAKVLAREGATVIVNDLKLESAQRAADEITAAGGRAMPFEANVTNKASLDAMVAATLKQYGRLDILVNNAGIEAPPHLINDLPESQWDRVVAVNLKGVMLCCQAVIPTMIEAETGTDHQHRFDGCYPHGVLWQRGLHGSETRRGWLDPAPLLGTGGLQHHGECGLPGRGYDPADGRRYDGGIPRKGHEAARAAGPVLHS